MQLKTPNNFVQCSCGRDIAIRHIDEVRVCTCGKSVGFSDKVKRYLIAKYVEHKKDSDIKIEGLEIRPVKYVEL